MGIVVALARNINQWWQSLEPWALALAFVVVVFIVSVAVWFTCRYLSSVFWKRTDYAYFLFVILGGGLAAYDLAANDLYKEFSASSNLWTHERHGTAPKCVLRIINLRQREGAG